MCRQFLFLVILLTSVESIAQDLVGHWTFEPGEELKDRTGNFEDLILEYARIEDGIFIVDTMAGATAEGYIGPDIGPDFTMVFWIKLLDIQADGGYPFILFSKDGYFFDALAFDDGGMRDSAWIVGSEMWNRYQYLDPGYVESSVGEWQQLALRFTSVGATEVQVAVFRNGVNIGSYITQKQNKYRTGSALVWFNRIVGTHTFRFELEEARLYNAALSQKQIQELGIRKVDPEGFNRWWFLLALPIAAGVIFYIRKRSRLSA